MLFYQIVSYFIAVVLIYYAIVALVKRNNKNDIIYAIAFFVFAVCYIVAATLSILIPGYDLIFIIIMTVLCALILGGMYIVKKIDDSKNKDKKN